VVPKKQEKGRQVGLLPAPIAIKSEKKKPADKRNTTRTKLKAHSFRPRELRQVGAWTFTTGLGGYELGRESSRFGAKKTDLSRKIKESREKDQSLEHQKG